MLSSSLYEYITKTDVKVFNDVNLFVDEDRNVFLYDFAIHFPD